MGRHRKPQDGSASKQSRLEPDIEVPSWDQNASPEEKMRNFDRYQEELDEKAHQDYLNMKAVERANYEAARRWI